MIPCWRNPKTDTWEPVEGNPTLTSLDGTQRAPLRTVCSATWSNSDRALFGIYPLRQASVPEGYRIVATNHWFDEATSEVVESFELEKLLPIDITKDRIHGKGNAGFRRQEQASGREPVRRNVS